MSIPVLDFDPEFGAHPRPLRADTVIDYITSHNLKVIWLLENHAHADHLSAAPYLQEKVGRLRSRSVPRSSRCTNVLRQKLFKRREGYPTSNADGSQFRRSVRGWPHASQSGNVPGDGVMMFRGIRLPGHCPMWSVDAVFYWRLRCSCPIMAPPGGQTSPVGTPHPCSVRCAGFCRFRLKPGCSCATITCQMAAASMCGGKTTVAAEREGQYPRP